MYHLADRSSEMAASRVPIYVDLVSSDEDEDVPGRASGSHAPVSGVQARPFFHGASVNLISSDEEDAAPAPALAKRKASDLNHETGSGTPISIQLDKRPATASATQLSKRPATSPAATMAILSTATDGDGARRGGAGGITDGGGDGSDAAGAVCPRLIRMTMAAATPAATRTMQPSRMWRLLLCGPAA